MKMVVRIATLVVVASVIVSISACSGTLRLNRDAPDRSDIRDTYLRDYPDGPHNKHIVKREVVRGMSVIEVLASWGLPDVRRTSKQTSAEFWTYYTVDPYSQMVSSYDLIFEDRQLNRWVALVDAISLEDFHKGSDFVEGDRISIRQPGGLSTDAGTLSKGP